MSQPEENVVVVPILEGTLMQIEDHGNLEDESQSQVHIDCPVEIEGVVTTEVQQGGQVLISVDSLEEFITSVSKEQESTALLQLGGGSIVVAADEECVPTASQDTAQEAQHTDDSPERTTPSATESSDGPGYRKISPKRGVHGPPGGTQLETDAKYQKWIDWAHQGAYQCTSCDFVSITLARIRSHVRTHQAKVKNRTRKIEGNREGETHPFGCEMCGKTFKRAKAFAAHITKKHLENGASVPDSIECAVNGMLGNTGETSADAASNEAKPASMYRCLHCDFVTRHRSNMTRHQDRLHADILEPSPEGAARKGKQKSFKCQFCEFTSARKDHVLRHERRHTGDTRYQCDICDKAFTRLDNLRNHRRTHTGDKPYACMACGKRFSQREALKKHVLTHLEVKDRTVYNCKFCDKTFEDYTALTVHSRIHPKEKNFLCGVCNTSFAHKSTLLCHLRIHTGEKPFSCTVCSKVYRTSSDLNRHMRSHTGEKRYSCGKCGTRYSHKHHLNRHMTKSHKDDTEDSSHV